jgi:hypothetical protein
MGCDKDADRVRNAGALDPMLAAVWRDRAHGGVNQVDGLDPSNLTFGDIIDGNHL